MYGIVKIGEKINKYKEGNIYCACVGIQINGIFKENNKSNIRVYRLVIYFYMPKVT